MWQFEKLTDAEKAELNQMIESKTSYYEIGLYLIAKGVADGCESCINLTTVRDWCDWAKAKNII